mgnify:CR=1 FL=1
MGATSTGTGRSEMAVIMATGKIWLRVPETMKIDARGRFVPGVYPKDLILKIIGDIGADGALYRAVEFGGQAIEDMSISGRLTMCNMTIEAGGIFCLYGPFNYHGGYTSESNARFDAFLKSRDPDSGIRDFEQLDRLAGEHGLQFRHDHEMPVNNRILVWRKVA